MGQRRKALAAGFAVAALTLSACGSGTGGTAKVANKPSFEAGTTMARISAAGKMKVGTKFDQPGFGLKGLDGKLAGFDVEVAKIIAGAMGVKADNIEWVESPSKLREELIEKGTVDMVAATYTINDKRKERITFAGPYYVAGQQLMVKSDNAKITGPADLKANPDQKVCSVTGSTPAGADQALPRQPLPAGAVRRLRQVRQRPAHRPGPGRDDRQRHPAGLRLQVRQGVQAGR